MSELILLNVLARLTVDVNN